MDQRKITEKIWLTIVVIIAITIRLIYLQQFSSSPLFSYPAGPDVSAYDSWAKAILAGHYLWHSFQIHAPLYPFFLAALYKVCQLNYYLVRLTQSLLGFMAFLPLFFRLKRSPATRCSAWVLLLLAAAYPPLIFYQSEFISEALLLPLLALLVYAFYRSDCRLNDTAGYFNRRFFWFILTGVLIGLAIICHPLSLVGCVMLLICSWLVTWSAWRGLPKGERLRAIAYQLARVAAVFCVILPVMFYNATLPNGRFAVQRNGGANLFLGNNAAATGGCYLRPGRDIDAFKYHAKRAADSAGMTTDSYFFGQTWRFISEHPGQWLKLLLAKALYFWNGHAMISSGDLEPVRFYTSLQRWSRWSSTLLLVLALSGLGFILCRFRAVVVMRYFLALGLGYWLALTLTVVSSRYRLPVFPVLAALAGYAICYIFRRLRPARSWRNWVVTAAIIVPAAALVLLPTPPANPAREEAEACAMLGEVYLLQGNSDRAEESFERVLQLGYQLDRAYTGLGGVCSQQGKLKEAEDYFLKALKENPYSCISYVNLGIVSMRQGKRLHAEHYFSFARQHWPRQPFLLYNYAIYQLKLKHPAEAAEYLQKYLTLKPYDSKALYMLGIIRLRQKRYEEAGACFRQVLKYNPEHSMAVFNLAGVEIERHNYRAAYRYINRFLRLRPDSARGLRVKRYIRQHLGDSAGPQ